MIDWAELFAFDTPILEIFVRGTLVYWSLFVLMRFFLKRGTGSVGISDMLMVVLLGDAIQNAMAGDYKSISDGVLLVSVMAGWNYLMDYVSYHSVFCRRFFEPTKICLVKDGVLNRKNMRAELITQDEIMSQLRFNEITDLKDVKEAYLESNGEISVIKADDEDEDSTGSGSPHKDDSPAV